MNTLTGLTNTLTRFVRDEDGISATEYAVLFIAILAAVVAGVGLLGSQIETIFGDAADDSYHVP